MNSTIVLEFEVTPPSLGVRNKKHDEYPQGFKHIQTDASVSGFEAGLAAVIVDDNEGQDSYVAVEFARVDSVLEAELAAISMALSLARNRGYDHVILEFDCAVAMVGLNERKLPVQWGSYPMFTECLIKTFDFQSVVFSAINRSVNCVADCLAMWARVSKIQTQGCLRDVAPFCGH
uniref:RNase H type-1 domain-containing protein n=1 Tax=Cannabis sativa TaxID=3483 RepID=A0A803P3N3_CANSA